MCKANTDHPEINPCLLLLCQKFAFSIDLRYLCFFFNFLIKIQKQKFSSLLQHPAAMNILPYIIQQRGKRKGNTKFSENVEDRDVNASSAKERCLCQKDVIATKKDKARAEILYYFSVPFRYSQTTFNIS